MPEHNVDKQLFSERIKLLRLEKKLTQKQMAENLGINERTYQHLEAGNYMPSNKTMMAIIGCFGMDSYKYLMDLPEGY